MEVTEADIARIPPRNLRVPVTDFVQVWLAAEQRNREATAIRSTDPEYFDHRSAAIALTCRWLATAIVRPEDGRRWYPARPPVSRHEHTAYEELIQAELLAAEKLELAPPPMYQEKPGRIEGICATLRWAWARTAPAPIEVQAVSTS